MKKVKMKLSLKFKFILFFTVFLTILCVATAVFSIIKTIAVASSIFAEQGLYMVEKASGLIDGDAFESLCKTLDAEDPFYIETQKKLFEQKQYSGCQYLYTMAYKQGDIWQFIIDGSTTPDDEEGFSTIGSEDDISEYDKFFLKTYETKQMLYSQPKNQGEWGWMVSSYAPIINSRGDAVGIIGCDFNADKLYSMLRSDVIQQLILALIFILVGLMIMIFLLRMIFKPISKVTSILKEISDGEGDLTKRIEINSDDEISELSNYFNFTLEKIKNLVVTIKNQSVTLTDIGSDLAANMNETAATINQITTNIQGIKSQSQNQSKSVAETNSSINKINKNIEALNDQVTSQAESVSQSSSAVEQMLANIQSVTQTLINNAKNATELTKASDIGKTGLQGVAADIQQIARDGEGLLEINAVMQQIASQTNLLSMNAAIEAAHAGESGRGFAVVADEIRKLAENSSVQSKTISQVLKNMHKGIEKITKSTEDVLSKFEAIDSGVRTVSEQEASIRNAMEEQGAGSRQIFEAIGRLNETTQVVRGSADEMLSESGEIINQGSKLEAATHEIANGMNEMAVGADQISAAVHSVNEASIKNKESIAALVEEVSRFKVDA